MFIKSRIKGLFAILTCILYAGCANVIPPSGGEKDNQAPKLIATYPADSLMISPTSAFQLLFDERIKIKTPSSIWVNPYQPIKIQQKGNNLLIKLSHQVDQSCEIVLNGGITDVHEDNEIKPFVVHYTGSSTDSVSGTAIDGYSGLPLEGIPIYVVPHNLIAIDSLKNPYAKSITGPGGIFSFHIALPDSFRIIAFQDANNNTLVDEGEYGGFSSFNSHKNKTINLVLFNDQVNQMPGILNISSDQYGVFQFIVSPRNANVKLLDNNLFTEAAYTIRRPGRWYDTLYWFSPQADMDTGRFDLYIDTVWLRDMSARHMNNSYFLRPFQTVPTHKNIYPGDTIHLQFSNPVSYYDTRQIQFTEDTLKVDPSKVTFRFTDKAQTELDVIYPIKENTRYTLQWKTTPFTDAFNQKIKPDSLVYITSSPKNNSNIEVIAPSLPLLHNNIYLEIKSLDGTFTQTQPIASSSKFTHLPAGKYTLIAFIDQNRNERFESSNLLNGFINEPILYRSGIIDLPAGFDQIVHCAW